MPRQNYISVAVSESTQAIFDDFVKAKEITKTAAFTDTLNIYMVAIDEKLYLLLKKHLNIGKVKERIISKDVCYKDGQNI